MFRKIFTTNKRYYSAPMGGTTGKNIKLPKLDKVKKENEKVYSSDIYEGKRSKKKPRPRKFSIWYGWMQ
jgi:hypothetical protein